MINVGLQLYTVRDEAEKDFIGTLKKVAAIGYKGVEFYNYYGMSAKELKKIIDELDIRAVNSHVFINNMIKDLSAEIEFAKTLGMDAITMPWLPEEYRTSRDAFLKISELLHNLDEKCYKAGIQLCYHNHDFEFKKVDEEYALDLFMKKANNLKLEFDTFWSSYAGIETIEYMKKNSARIKFIHLKDMIKDSKPVFAEVGEGCLDIMSFVKTAISFGVEWAFVEQDICKKPSLESAKLSFDNLTKMGAVK